MLIILRTWTKIATVGIVLTGVPLLFSVRAWAQSGETSHTAVSGSSEISSSIHSLNTQGGLNSQEQSGAQTFVNSGNLPAQGNTTSELNGSVLPYLTTSPELNGPGSVEWCRERSTCAQTANQCATDCQNNTAANGTAQSDIGEQGTQSQTTQDAGQSQVTTNITNFGANDCVAVCQNMFDTCSAAVSNVCDAP